MAFRTSVLVLAVPLVTQAPMTGLAQDVDLAAEEQQIRELNRQWVEWVAAKDVKAIADLYAEDGLIMPPNATQAEGPEAVGKVWESITQLPEVAMSFEPTTIEIAQSGDMAYDIGTYSLSFAADQGQVEDEGKYVVVWVKEGDDWKVAADIFNTNQPLQ